MWNVCSSRSFSASSRNQLVLIVVLNDTSDQPAWSNLEFTLYEVMFRSTLAALDFAD